MSEEMLDRRMCELVDKLWRNEEPWDELKFCEIFFEYKFDGKSFPELVRRLEENDILSGEELSEEQRKKLLEETKDETMMFEENLKEEELDFIARVAAENPSFVLGGEAIATMRFSFPRHIIEDTGVKTVNDAIKLFKGYIEELEILQEMAAKHGITFKSDQFVGFEADYTIPFEPNETLRQVLSRIEKNLADLRHIVDNFEVIRIP